MGLFDFLKKQKHTETAPLGGPYNEDAPNRIYQLLFCDNPELYNQQPPHSYPFDILLSETSSADSLQKIIDDTAADPRVRILAYNRQRAMGHQPGKKELLAVIVEVGLDGGLDVLASFVNGTARYINQTGKILIWESTDDKTANDLTDRLFAAGRHIITQIGPWDQPRRPRPATGYSRISFLVSDGLYFGEAPTDTLFSDPLAIPALSVAAELMQYLTERAMQKDQPQ